LRFFQKFLIDQCFYTCYDLKEGEKMKKKRGMSSRELIKMVKADGWYCIGTVGDHHQFKHSTKKGKLTIIHPEKNLPSWIVNDTLKKAGLK